MFSKPIKTDKRLLALIERAKGHVMTSDEIRAQRISFVYGQMMDCAPHLSKQDIGDEHDKLYGKHTNDQ